MNNLNLIIGVILIVILVLIAFYVFSNVQTKSAALGVVLIIGLTAALSFLAIKKEIVLKVGSDKIKIVNVSFYCPYCGAYVPDINTRFCSKCGDNLEHIKNNLSDF